MHFFLTKKQTNESCKSPTLGGVNRAVKKSTKRKLEYILYGLTFLGIFAMGQPFFKVMWGYSFTCLLVVVVAFNVLNHISETTPNEVDGGDTNSI